METKIKEKYNKYMNAYSGTPFEDTLTEREKKFLLSIQEHFLDKLILSRKHNVDCEFDLPIWVITVFEKVDTLKSEKDGRDLGWPDTGSRCTWGFYYDKEKALDALRTNATDMWETCYDYAVLEKYRPGVPGDCYGEPAQFFKYNEEKNGYFMIPTPDALKHSIGFAA